MTELDIEVGSVDFLAHVTEGRELPPGYDAWAMRSVHADLSSSRGYQYPFPGRIAKAAGPFDKFNTGGCPTDIGDGICASTTFAGMASGSISARTLLLVAYRERDVLGRESGGKIRLKQFRVVALLSAEKILANLYGANLRGANLRGADLYGANLYGANLYGANLCGANLCGANLYGANLYGANLYGADLYGANLRGANLYGANLYGADLYGANLRGANLYGALNYVIDSTRWKVGTSGLVIPV